MGKPKLRLANGKEPKAKNEFRYRLNFYFWNWGFFTVYMPPKTEPDLRRGGVMVKRRFKWTQPYDYFKYVGVVFDREEVRVIG